MADSNTGTAVTAPPGVRPGPLAFLTSRWGIRALILMAAAALAAWGVLNGPWYQEWRLSRMALPALAHEMPHRENSPRFLYWAGRRLDRSNP